MKAAKLDLTGPIELILNPGDAAIFTLNSSTKKSALTIVSCAEIRDGSISRAISRHQSVAPGKLGIWKIIGDEITDELEQNLSDNGIKIEKKVKRSLPITLVYDPITPKIQLEAERSTLGHESQLPEKIRVLVVDDSQTIRGLLTKIISADPRMTVIAAAERPSEVENLISLHRPHVITLDINMPEESGVSLLRRIYPKYRIPTIMISAVSLQESREVLDALEIGAIDYMQKPNFSELQSISSLLSEKIITAAKSQTSSRKASFYPREVSSKPLDQNGLILIGASTGGTEAIKHVLLGLPKEIPPILIVQHIPPVFSKAFAERMNQICPFQVKEANQNDEVIKSNCVYIAAGGTQMSIAAESKNGEIRLKIDENAAPLNRHKPSVDFLFHSAARELKRNRVTAAILTGMGADGAVSMLELKNRGFFTIAQDEKSSVVFGMPKEAIALGGISEILPLDQIAARISKSLSKD